MTPGGALDGDWLIGESNRLGRRVILRGRCGRDASLSLCRLFPSPPRPGHAPAGAPCAPLPEVPGPRWGVSLTNPLRCAASIRAGRLHGQEPLRPTHSPPPSAVNKARSKQ
ncbi:hypothetical protein AAFF_G00019490 [Aldrovandia affinis]|uniref:Uncharacterized protein n=1 Tax=Aldrovandia affinis TaxID=143900 RepID=A0AAD7WGQ9_9TELE|nr:hypothetical protein AAFF_G00019490 [Aldrovandia affinis]